MKHLITLIYVHQLGSIRHARFLFQVLFYRMSSCFVKTLTCSTAVSRPQLPQAHHFNAFRLDQPSLILGRTVHCRRLILQLLVDGSDLHGTGSLGEKTKGREKQWEIGRYEATTLQRASIMFDLASWPWISRLEFSFLSLKSLKDTACLPGTKLIGFLCLAVHRSIDLTHSLHTLQGAQCVLGSWISAWEVL